MPGWLILLVVAALVVTLVVWVLFDDAVARVESGQLGLVLLYGKATDKVLPPGPHLVLAFRRRMIEIYPSLELAYRAGGPAGATPALEREGPALHAVLGDRTAVVVSYTVRFRLDESALRSVHERFGPQGIWSAAGDVSGRAVRAVLAEQGREVDELFGEARRALEEDLGAAVGEALAADGLTLVLFVLGDVDLGRTGEVIQGAARARFGLAQEEAEAATRVARARNDAKVESVIGGIPMDSALRYREVDAWHDVALTLVQRRAMLPGALGRPEDGGPAPDQAPEAAPATGEVTGETTGETSGQ